MVPSFTQHNTAVSNERNLSLISENFGYSVSALANFYQFSRYYSTFPWKAVLLLSERREVRLQCLQDSRLFSTRDASSGAITGAA